MTSSSLPLNQHPVYVLLRKNFHQTKTHLSITNLDFGHPLIERSPHIFSLFLQRATKKLRSVPPKLKRLTLDLKLVRSSPLPLYNNLLKDLKHIEYLKVPLCPNYAGYFPSYFHFLMKTLKRARNLRVFEVIVLGGYQWQEDNSMQCLIKTLSKSAPRLKDVRIIFENSYSQSQNLRRNKPFLNGLGIQRLAVLKSLTLHLPEIAFITLDVENEFRFHLSALRSFRKLESLDLAVLEGEVPHGLGCTSFVFDPPKKRLLPSLKRFQWKIVDPPLSGIEFLHSSGSELARSFGISLEDFTLKFKQIRTLNDIGLKKVNESFASLKTDLSQIHLPFSNLNSKALNSLISFLSAPKLMRMQVLDLLFLDYQGISDKFITKFAEAISPKLKYLRLRFEFIKESEKGFVGALKKLFGEEGITDKGISKFGEILAERCGDLQFVWLEFARYEKISDEGAKSLCESLSRIESLKRVWLKFRLCGEVSGKYAKEILGKQRDVQFALI